MSELEIYISQRAELLKQLSEWQKKLSEAKFLTKHDEKKNIRDIEKQIKAVDKKIKEAQKYEYFDNGLAQGIDVRANQTTAIAGVVTAAGTAVSSVAGSMLGEYGLLGKGQVGLAEQDRLSKNGSKSPTPLASMSNNTLMLIGGGVLLVLIIFKGKK